MNPHSQPHWPFDPCPPDPAARPQESRTMRSHSHLVALAFGLALALAGSFLSAGAAQAQLPNPPAGHPTLPQPRPGVLQASLPVLNFLGNDEVCDSWIEVQNVGST